MREVSGIKGPWRTEGSGGSRGDEDLVWSVPLRYWLLARTGRRVDERVWGSTRGPRVPMNIKVSLLKDILK